MDDYKPNSNRFKEEQKKVETTKKEIRSVVTGSTKTKKKSEVRKFTDIFMPEDVSSIKSYVISDVVVPAIKAIISDTINAILYPGGGGPKKNSPATRVSYSGYYRGERERRDAPPSRLRNGLDYDDIIFDNRGDAEAVLTAMEDIIAQYQVVSVGDLYDLAQISTHNYAVNNYGWSNLQTAQVVRVRDGWMLKLPRALPLN